MNDGDEYLLRSWRDVLAMALFFPIWIAISYVLLALGLDGTSASMIGIALTIVPWAWLGMKISS